MLEFDELGHLPSGTTVLEASAGTGKTHQISNLVCRFVAAGVPIDKILMVTFGNEASKELRSRVHERLSQLARVLAGVEPANGDTVASQLTAQPPALERINAALERFDAATIATTHTFCAMMLNHLGVIADWEGTERFTNELSELVGQVCEDVYVATFKDEARPAFPLDYARRLAKAAIEHTAALFEHAQHRAELDFAEAVRAEVKRRKGLARLYTYDDLIERMQRTMNAPQTAEPARKRLSERFPVVLVDEFQDTDPPQWSIIQKAFVGKSDVVLIGDPKQSIYAFRNADLNSYLEALSRADEIYGLPRNYRSDPKIVKALSRVFTGIEFGSEDVIAQAVEAHRTTERLREKSGADTPALQVRVLAESAPDHQLQAHIGADLVRQVQHLLAHYTLTPDHEETRNLSPGDIAVLTRKGKVARELVDMLNFSGVPAVHRGGSSPFATQAAADWLQVLRAWVEPSMPLVRAAALTCIGGAELPALIRDDGSLLGSVAQRLREADRAFVEHGLAAAWRRLRDRFDIDLRLAKTPRGRETLSNLEQIAELLHSAARREGLSQSGLTNWLGEQLDHTSADAEGGVRLESDADAVQVMTMHSAKGLQFPVVMLPSPSFDETWGEKYPFVFADAGRRVLFTGMRLERAKHWTRHLEDVRAEELRLLYVAMTRAQCAVFTWWTRAKSVPTSSLHRVLSRHPNQGRPAPRYPDIAPTQAGFDPALVSVEPFQPTQLVPANPTRSTRLALRVRTLDREIDQAWGRKSYSGLTANAHDSFLLADEPATPGVVSSVSGLDAPVPLGELPGGVVFGSLVHLVLEHLDWDHDPEIALDALLAKELPRIPLSNLDVGALQAGLLAALRTPLGALTGNRSLLQIPTAQRLAELEFDLPLSRRSRVADLARVFQDHLSPEHLLGSYGGRLAASEAAPEALTGMLTGSIDVVLQVDDRFVVLDYKTNKLAGPGEEKLGVGHFRAQAMAEAMMASHYPLQALLYCVALHRYLAWRLPRYQPKTHLGGVGYLFVRGMIGPETPVVDGMPCGVFSWFPTPEMVLSASAVLGGEGA